MPRSTLNNSNIFFFSKTSLMVSTIVLHINALFENYFEIANSLLCNFDLNVVSKKTSSQYHSLLNLTFLEFLSVNQYQLFINIGYF